MMKKYKIECLVCKSDVEENGKMINYSWETGTGNEAKMIKTIHESENEAHKVEVMDIA